MGVLHFAVKAQYPSQGGVVVGVDDGGGIDGVGLAHAHVESSVKACGEALFRSVELVRGDTEVGNDAVDGTVVVHLDEILEKAEVHHNYTPTGPYFSGDRNFVWLYYEN